MLSPRRASLSRPVPTNTLPPVDDAKRAVENVNTINSFTEGPLVAPRRKALPACGPAGPKSGWAGDRPGLADGL